MAERDQVFADEEEKGRGRKRRRGRGEKGEGEDYLAVASKLSYERRPA
jgi:hypothetical protein